MAVQQQLIYVLLGSAMTLVNAPILVTVLKYRVLRHRKEYIMFAGLALADLLAGLATLEAGIYRLYVGSREQKIARSQCALIPHTWLFLFASPAQAISIFMVSLDRLVAIVIPYKYFVFGPAYRFSGLTCCLLTGVGYSVSATLTSLAIYRLTADDTSNDGVDVYCVAFVIIDIRSFRWLFYTRLVFAIAGIAAYLLVLLIYKWHNTKTCRDLSSAINLSSLNQYQRRQNTLTKTVGFTCTLTTLLYIVPIIANMAAKNIYSEDSASWAVYVWMCHCLNSLLNAAIYTFRHADMKDSIWYCLKCRELPSNFVDQNRNIRSNRRSQLLSNPQFRYEFTVVDGQQLRKQSRMLRSMIDITSASVVNRTPARRHLSEQLNIWKRSVGGGNGGSSGGSTPRASYSNSPVISQKRRRPTGSSDVRPAIAEEPMPTPIQPSSSSSRSSTTKMAMTTSTSAVVGKALVAEVRLVVPPAIARQDDEMCFIRHERLLSRRATVPYGLIESRLATLTTSPTIWE